MAKNQSLIPGLQLSHDIWLREHERLTIAGMKRLTEANRNTLKVGFRELTPPGQIAKHGQGRAICYSIIAVCKGVRRTPPQHYLVSLFDCRLTGSHVLFSPCPSIEQGSQ